jgi:hypothetical protein
MKKEVWIIIWLFLGIFIVNYGVVDAWLVETFIDYEEGIVERIIDGDTVVITDYGLQITDKIRGKISDVGDQKSEVRVRMLGINSPEKGEVGSDEAQAFLEEMILGERVRLYFDGAKTDRYGRTLAYIFLNGENVNLESVRQGFSNFYFPAGKQRFYGDFVDAWRECLLSDMGICQKAKLEAGNQKLELGQEDKRFCIRIEMIDVKEQVIIIRNGCRTDVDLNGWSIKDEGRKKFVFGEEILKSGNVRILYADDFGKGYVWTKSGDSAFLRNEENLLVDFFHY